MEDLNDKVTGGTLAASEWNQVPSEIQNVVEGLGITLSGGDLNQLGKAIAGYVANGTFYSDSGIADAYVLTVIGSKQALPEYTDGMLIRFVASADNTGGAATVNVAGLGVKSITNPGGTTLKGAEIIAGGLVNAAYVLASDRFELAEIVPAKVNDMIGLVSISTGQRQRATMLGYFVTFPQSEFNGGGEFVWQTSLNKNLANGVTIVDPDNIGGFDGTSATRDAFLAAQGGGVGSGCWVRTSTDVNVDDAGAVGDGIFDDTESFNSARASSYTVHVTKGSYSITSVPVTMDGNEFILTDDAYLIVTGDGINRNIQQVTRSTYITANGGLPAALVDGYNLYRTLSVTGGHIVVEAGATGVSDRIPFLQYIGVAPTPAKTGLQPFPVPLAVNKTSFVLNDSTATGVGIHGGWGSYVKNASFTGFDSGKAITLGGDGTFNPSSHPQLVTIENNSFNSCGPITTIKGTCTNSAEALNIIGNKFNFVSDVSLLTVNALIWEENYYITNNASIIVTDCGRAQMNGGYYQCAQNGIDATHNWLVRVTNCADFSMSEPDFVKNSTATTRNSLGFFTNASNDFKNISVHGMTVNGGVAGGDAITFTTAGAFTFDGVNIGSIHSINHINILNFFPSTTDPINVTIRDLTQEVGDGTVKYIEGFSSLDRSTLDAPQYHVFMDVDLRATANSTGAQNACLAYTMRNPFKSQTLAAGGITNFVSVSNAATITPVAIDRKSIKISLIQNSGLTAGDIVEATGTIDLIASDI